MPSNNKRTAYYTFKLHIIEMISTSLNKKKKFNIKICKYGDRKKHVKYSASPLNKKAIIQY